MGKKAAAKRLAKTRGKTGVSDTPERQSMEAYFDGKRGAVDDISDDDISALFVAEVHGLDKNILLQMVRDRDCSPLHSAVMFSNLEAVKALVESGVDLERKEYAKRTPLHLSILFPNIEIARCLLDNGAKIDAVDIRRWTSLHLAAKAEKVEFVALLIERGANESLVTDEEKTASEYSLVVERIKAERQADEFAAKHGISLGSGRGRGEAL